MTKTKQIIAIAREIAKKTRGFFKDKHPGIGDKANLVFMKKLRKESESKLGEDYSEKQLIRGVKSAVDFYIPHEKTIIEVALSLQKANSEEFYKDIFKAVLAKVGRVKIKQLVFVSKPGAKKRHQRPFSQAIKRWLKQYFAIEINIVELTKE